VVAAWDGAVQTVEPVLAAVWVAALAAAWVVALAVAWGAAPEVCCMIWRLV
jgi:hypothetical protein